MLCQGCAESTAQLLPADDEAGVEGTRGQQNGVALRCDPNAAGASVGLRGSDGGDEAAVAAGTGGTQCIWATPGSGTTDEGDRSVLAKYGSLTVRRKGIQKEPPENGSGGRPNGHRAPVSFVLIKGRIG